MVWQDDLGAIGDEELTVNGQTVRLEHRDLLQQRRRVDNHAIADHTLASRPQYTAGHKVKHKLFAVNDDGVAGIVTARVTRYDSVAFAEHVHDLAFALVTPLGAKDDGGLLSVHERFSKIA